MPDDSYAADLLAAFPPVPTEAWLDRIRADLKGAPLERLASTLPEGFDLQPFYRADDLDGLDAAPLPAPARAVFRQDVVARELEEAARRARTALGDGAEALGLHLATGGPEDLPVRTADDLRRLLDGLPETARLDVQSAWMARPLLAVLAERAPHLGLIANDPFGLLLRTGALPVEAAFDEAAALVADAGALGVAGQVLRVDLAPVDEAGGTAVEALAMGLAAASELFARLGERGAEAAEVARRIRFSLPIGTRYFVEIAKLRALRRLFPLVAEAYGVEEAVPVVEATTSRWTLARFDRHANLLRHTTEAAAALIGGCDVLRVRPFDAALGRPSEHALRLARMLPLILRHEAHLDAVADPAAGSYYVEILTDRLGRAAWSLFQEIEARGGLIEALRKGFLQDRISDSRAAQREALATRQRVLIGVNHYPDAEETRPDESAVPVEHALAAGVSFARELDDVRVALRGGARLDGVLAAPEGLELAIPPLDAGRLAQPFEALRLRVEAHAREAGRRPVAMLLPLGEAATANARATFARNLLGSAGFAIAEADRFEDAAEAGRAAVAAGADLAVLCAPDADLGPAAETLAAIFKQAEDAPRLVVAGPPQEVGGAVFLHHDADALALLETLAETLFTASSEVRP